MYEESFKVISLAGAVDLPMPFEVFGLPSSSWE